MSSISTPSGSASRNSLAVELRDDPRIEHRDLARVGLRANQPPDALLEADHGARHLVVHERVAAALRSMNSCRASTSGRSGTSNGSRVMMTLRRPRPRTSTPCQKLFVPNSTDSFVIAEPLEQHAGRAVLALHEHGMSSSASIGLNCAATLLSIA